MRRLLLLIVVIVSVCGAAFAQEKAEVSAQIGKGIQFKTKDDLFYLKFRTRIQTRWDFENTLPQDYTDKDGVYYPNPDLLMENRAFVKRSRLKFDGYFLNKNLVYKIEYDVVGGYVRDALIKYKMGNVQLWFGQGKLPGNRQRVVSSANLQMVDRSISNKYYNLDRDVGFQLHHKFKIGDIVLADRWAITSGNGILDNGMSKGVSFTGKLEVLPLGEFTSKGDYKEADLAREQTPKIAFAGYANYNPDSYKDRGQVGSNIGGEADLLYIGGDFLLKYKGFSFLTEAGTRSVTDDGEFVTDAVGDTTNVFYTGYGGMLQTGYVFKNNWEISGRYALTRPNETYYNGEITDYTMCVTKYIIGHNFKLQADVTYRERPQKQDMIIGRLQLEFQF